MGNASFKLKYFEYIKFYSVTFLPIFFPFSESLQNVADDIGSNVENSHAATAQGKSQLAKAAKTQRSNSSLVTLYLRSVYYYESFQWVSSVHSCYTEVLEMQEMGVGFIIIWVICIADYCSH